jgi:hypothetical protein
MHRDPIFYLPDPVFYLPDPIFIYLRKVLS